MVDQSRAEKLLAQFVRTGMPVHLARVAVALRLGCTLRQVPQ